MRYHWLSGLLLGLTVHQGMAADEYPCPDCTLDSYKELQRQNDILIGEMNAGCYDHLESYFNKLQSQYEKGEVSDRALQANFDAFRNDIDQEQVINWLQQYPNSFAANLVMGLYYRSAGFELRGKAYIGKTPQENLELMQAAFDKAEPYFQKAITLVKRATYMRAYLIKMYRVAGNNMGYQKELASAIKEDEKSAILHLVHMESLEPKWGGSYELMEQFYDFSTKQQLPKWSLDELKAMIYSSKFEAAYNQKQFEDALQYAEKNLAVMPSYFALTEIIKAKLHIKKDIAALEWAEPEMKQLEQWDEYNHYAIGYRGYLEMSRQHYTDGLALLTKSATPNPTDPKGSDYAQYWLGMSYLHGNGVKQDKVIAIQWLLKSQKQGNTNAGTELVNLHIIPAHKEL